MIDIPIPAPKYNNAAIIVGGISSSRIFDIGELIAYNAAARIAQSIAKLCCLSKIIPPIIS